MIYAEFVNDGEITFKGEKVSCHKAGDKVTILEDVTDDLCKVIVTSGESESSFVVVDKIHLKII